MRKESKKVLTGFRLSESNVKFIEDTSKKLGLNKTSALDMLLTVVRKDKNVLTSLIQRALDD